MSPPTATFALVHGLGLSGLAAARLLRRHQVRVLGVDRRPAGELELGALAGDPGVELLLGAEPNELPAGVDLVVASPGIPADHPLHAAARDAGVPITGELELAFREAAGPVVAITGSNGKSTTTALTGHLLAIAGIPVEVCGNIGVPFADCLEGPAGRTFVVEVSSFQLETVDRFRPRAAALLNIAPDHLDRHRDLDGYTAAKARMLANQAGDDVAVLNADDPRLAQVAVRARRRLFSAAGATVEDGCTVVGERVVERDGARERALFAVADLPLPGAHNLENAMAAALLARACGVEPALIPGALHTFRGLPHRAELVAEHGGVRYVDDSKATNVAAALRSLAGYGGARVHAILGGRAKAGDDLAALAEAAARHVATSYLIGEAAPAFDAALRAAGVPTELCGTLDRAVAAAASAAGPGEVVLLAPAAASYDQYRNYAERGGHFRRLVDELAPRRAAGGG